MTTHIRTRKLSSSLGAPNGYLKSIIGMLVEDRGRLEIARQMGIGRPLKLGVSNKNHF